MHVDKRTSFIHDNYTYGLLLHRKKSFNWIGKFLYNICAKLMKLMRGDCFSKLFALWVG